MDLLTIMINIAKFFKNKLLISLSKGYKIKVDKNSYMLFKKKEDYVNLIYLEKVFFDLFKNLLFNDDEDKEIRVFFRLSLIKKYIKSLSEIKIKILYDKKKSENPFMIKFPNIGYVDYSELLDGIWENLEDLENRDLKYKYMDITDLLKDVISVKYYKRNLYQNNPFNKQRVFYDLE